MTSLPAELMTALHGAPPGSWLRSAGQRLMRVPNTAPSLPPKPTVTRSVSAWSAVFWAGMPGRWLVANDAVSAPAQLRSASWAPRAFAARVG